ncbi:MAG: TetR/AcrR family transcriptional regulator [Gordonibacter sp.]|nr:TetR/AcrR family transcriptional regulator [Gordonibacter sp.]
MAKDTQERKQRIIDAAIDVIKEKSVEAASMRDIAKRAGITTGSIYYHYESKNDLLFDIVNQSVHFSTRVSEMDKSSFEEPKEVLDLIKEEIARRLAKKDEQLFHLKLLSDAFSENGKFKERHRDTYKEIIDRTADLFYDAYGFENAAYKRSAASFLVAALDGMAIQSALGVLPEDLATSTERFNDFFGQSIENYLRSTSSGNE